LIPRIKETRNLPIVISRNEVSRLLHGSANLKHRAVLATLYSTGMRPQELTWLKTDDVRWDDQVIFISHGKGHKQRFVPLTDDLSQLLRRYLAERSAPESAWLFASIPRTSANHQHVMKHRETNHHTTAWQLPWVPSPRRRKHG
jgi:site-specific recombinase XerD